MRDATRFASTSYNKPLSSICCKLSPRPVALPRNPSSTCLHRARRYLPPQPKGGSHPVFKTAESNAPGDENDPIGLVLREVVGLEPGEFACIKKQTGNTGSLRESEVEEALEVLLSISSKERVRQLLLNHPSLLPVLSDLPSWIDFLIGYGVERRDFFKLLATDTDLFVHGSLYNAGLVIMYLMQLGLTHKHLSCSVVPKCALLLGKDTSRDIEPVLRFLEQDLAIEDPGIRLEMISRCPRLLALSVEGELRPRMTYLHSLGLGKDQVYSLVTCASSLLMSDPVPLLGPALTFLQGRCGLDQGQALGVLVACPHVIGLSTDNLARKWEFLTREMAGGKQQLVLYPPYLASSLLNEIGPRFFYAKHRNLLQHLALDTPAGSYSSSTSTASTSSSTAPTVHATAGPGTAAATPATATSCTLPLIDLAKMLGGDVTAFKTLLGVQEGEGDDFERFRRRWQVTEGRAWSGMVTVVPSEDDSW
mmetsp:Transcript_38153/g.85037  ORF Transcript_38153/g.85037 Transcript_38153/m.85037 type:complete len:478 (+) Transcript_38153:137-1570(+)